MKELKSLLNFGFPLKNSASLGSKIELTIIILGKLFGANSLESKLWNSKFETLASVGFQMFKTFKIRILDPKRF